MREAFRIAIEIYRQPAFRKFGVEPDLPVSNMDDDVALDAHIRSVLTNDHHAAGTCQMGEGENAVVDSALCVRGVRGLRVVDASIMPRVVSGNTNAPTIMIAEKASDMILGRTPLSPAQVGSLPPRYVDHLTAKGQPLEIEEPGRPLHVRQRGRVLLR